MTNIETRAKPEVKPLLDIVREHHDNRTFAAAIDLNVDYLSIFGEWADRVGERDEFRASLNLPAVSEAEAAESAYLETLAEVSRAFFSKITREAAVNIANALPDCARITVSDDMDYNATTFTSAWNDIHGSEKPIEFVGGQLRI